MATIPSSSKPLEVERRSVGQAPPAAPQDFRLVTVTQDKGEAPPPGPPAVPQQKPSLEAIDRQVLQSVDDHAIQVSGGAFWCSFCVCVFFNILLSQWEFLSWEIWVAFPGKKKSQLCNSCVTQP